MLRSPPPSYPLSLHDALPICNAFDAGVATAFTLQVVEPHLNGPGGDVPIIVHDTKRGRTEVICGQGPAPAKATIAHYRSEEHTSELQSRRDVVCRLLLEKKNS